MNQFIEEGVLDKVENYNLDQNAQTRVIERINKKIGAKYFLPRYNCEHFVNEILTSVAESKQVQTAVAFTIGLIFTYFFIDRIGNKV